MKNKSNGFQYLKVERQPNDQLIDLLEENKIGTPGKSMVYQHHNVPAKLKTLSDPYFINLSIRNKLYGTVCFSKRVVLISGNKYEAFYLRYFTFREKLRASNPKSSPRKSSGKIRAEITKLMDGHGLDYKDNLIMYAYVDADNVSSKRLVDEFGFKKISNFRVVPFSRIFPKKSNFVKIADRSMQKEVEAKLLEMYINDQLVSFEHLFSCGNYFVFEINGMVVCGVQAIPDQWDILDLPGVGGQLMMNIIPKIPMINRLFHPNFKFVFLESIFCLDGYEQYLNSLFESVLAHFQIYSGIMCLDPKSKVYAMVKKHYLGLTHKFQGEKEIDVVVKTSDEKLLKANLPVSISGQDVL